MIGLMIASPDPVPAGTKLQVRMAWPLDLDGGIPLQLVATGKVVRADEAGFAVELRAHEFRTLGRKNAGDNISKLLDVKGSTSQTV